VQHNGKNCTGIYYKKYYTAIIYCAPEKRFRNDSSEKDWHDAAIFGYNSCILVEGNEAEIRK